MIFNRHSHLVGSHAQFSPSKYHWLNYSDEKMRDSFFNSMAARRGDQLHALAAEAIRLGVKLQGNRTTLSQYVNDAIGFRMTPEQILYYSDNFYGSADAITIRRSKLRIHDLKTGVTPTSEKQLEIYAALFCLEYKFKPHELEIELRIYQNDEIRVYEADSHDIVIIMDKIVTWDKRINEWRTEAML